MHCLLFRPLGRQAHPRWSRWGQIIEDSRARLHDLSQVQINHARREASHVAYALAKLVVNQLLNCVWVGECPLPIQPIIIVEQVISS